MSVLNRFSEIARISRVQMRKNYSVPWQIIIRLFLFAFAVRRGISSTYGPYTGDFGKDYIDLKTMEIWPESRMYDIHRRGFRTTIYECM